MEQIACHQKGQGSAGGCGDNGVNRPHDGAEDGAGRQRQDGRSGERQGGLDDIDRHEAGHRGQFMGGMVIQQRLAVGLQRLQGEKTLQAEMEEHGDGSNDGQDDDDLLRLHWLSFLLRAVFGRFSKTGHGGQ